MAQDVEWVRLVAFLAAFALYALWEILTPRRTLTQKKWVRWLNNLSLAGLNNLMIVIMPPAAAVQAANWAATANIGLLHQFSLPVAAEILLAVVALDLVIYFQHRLFHYVPWLWQLHKMHHTDLDVDVTTGIRFHPLEILLSAWIKVGAVTLLGVSPLAVIVFEIVLNASAMFNHSNIRLPDKADARLRWLIVTPDMHRIHHSIRPEETHTNFGFFLTWWDKWFASYRPAPVGGETKLVTGLTDFHTSREQWLDRMLTQPFRTQRQDQLN